ncbi:MAG: ribose-phosphate pyrophosphokinase [Tidjanibacter sp.]|nr:ribose-phosphate pyrophosphokinase [Tidjanibacter sp.]MBR6831181.1 ribose-phosphate pyrophosphokinase [Tidjanibacter sp.]
MAEHKLKIFACRGSYTLAEKIAKSYGTQLGNMTILRFSDGEFQPTFDESIRGCTVFIVQSTPPPAENLMELLLTIDAARRASAHKVIAVIPYFGWARQDRKDRPRVPIGAKLVANLLTAAGADRVITMDMHADQIQGFFDIPVDHIHASKVFLPYISTLENENLSVATPDIGGAKRANAYASFLNLPLVVCHKHRERPNVVGTMTAIGEVKGRDLLLFDDMIDTAGTITKAANMFMEMGANSVRAVTTHPVLSGEAYERINNSALKEVIVTDTIPLRTDKDLSKFTVLTVADTLADVIERVNSYREISSQYIF